MPYTAEEQICLNEARTKIVPCDSPEARSNLALPGAVLEDDVAIKYGLMKGKAGAANKADDAAAEDEELTVETTDKKAMGAPAANKAVTGADNKAKK